MKEYLVYAWKKDGEVKVDAVSADSIVDFSVINGRKAFTRTFISAPNKKEAIAYFKRVWLKQCVKKLVAKLPESQLNVLRKLSERMQLVFEGMERR